MLTRPIVKPLALPGVMLITGSRAADERGAFSELFRAPWLVDLGIEQPFVQDNVAYNHEAHVLRGLHWQAAPFAQAKWVRCLRGRILDVAADVCPESPTYGQWVSHELSGESAEALFIPERYAHGYLTLEPETLVFYKVSELWHPEAEGHCRWDDPTLGIAWGIQHPILSPKDAQAPWLVTDVI